MITPGTWRFRRWWRQLQLRLRLLGVLDVDVDVCSPDVDSLDVDEGVERPCLMMTIPRNEPRERRTSNDLGSEH